MADGTRRPLTVRVGVDLDALADDLAAHLGSHHRSVLGREVVVVPTPGLGQWLEERLSRRLGASLLGDGICANVEFPLWGGLLRRLLGLRALDRDPWSVGAMTLASLEVLSGWDDEQLAPNDRGALRFPVARTSADLFDQLFRWRPDVADSWLESSSSDPRAALLRHLADRATTPPPHRSNELLVERLGQGDADVELPDCVHFFGSDSVPGGPATPKLLDALAASREVVVHLVVPSVPRFERLRAATAPWGSTPPPRGDDDLDDGLLLRSWGASSADAARLVAQLPARASTSVTALDAGPGARRHTLLGALQASIRDEPVEPAPQDDSVSLHACVGAARQVEAARDAILHALVDDPTLRASDVAILCADLPRFGPHLEAVLGSPEGAPAIPYTLRDRSLSRAVPYVAAVDASLELLGGRLSRSAVLELLRSRFVQRRFGLDLDDVDRIASWADSTDVNWGLDGPHRTSAGLPATFESGTWRRSLDRLLAGVALPATGGAPVLGLRPVDVGYDLDRVGALCELLGTIASLHEVCAPPRDAASWCEFVRTVAEALLAPPWDDPRSATLVGRMLDDIASDAPTEPTAIEFDEFRAVFADRASSVRELAATGPGGVTVTSFAPLRNVPFRVVVLLGLDEASLPQASSVDGAFGAPRIGDRDRGADARGALLAAVLSTRSRLVATYDGRDVVTNDRIAPSTVLSELRDALARVCTDDVADLERRHPRHAHGLEDLLVGDGLGPFGFDRGALQRAGELAAADREAAGTRIGAVAAPRGDATIHRDEFVSFLTAPQRTYLSTSLGVRLPPRNPLPSDDLPTALDELERWRLVTDLVALGLREGAWGRSKDEWAELCDAWAAELDGPLSALPGQLGALALHGDDGVAARGKSLCDAVAKLGGESPSEPVDVEVTLAGGEVLVGEVATRKGTTILSWTASGSGARLHVGSAVDLLLLTASHPETRWRAVRVWRPSTKRAVSAPSLVVPGESPEARRERALEALEVLAGLRRRGLGAPIPLFLNVSMSVLKCLEDFPGAGPEELAAAGLGGWSPTRPGADGADLAVRYCFDGSYDDLLTMPVEPGDPEPNPKAGGSRLLACSLELLEGLLALGGPDDEVLLG